MQLSQYLSMRVAPPSCTSYLTSWEGMPLHTQQGDPSVSLLIVSCLLLYIKHSDDTIFSSPSSTSFGILSFFTVPSLLVNPVTPLAPLILKAYSNREHRPSERLHSRIFRTCHTCSQSSFRILPPSNRLQTSFHNR